MRYRQRGKLKGTQIGRHIRYTRKALQEFLEKMTNE
ncbi:MAG: helix-turn-helix domain-containing protein [Planctomycetes bacterium]|nr:helix-turn-helix domain-containing protein [Planctomycetota bacterium]